MIYLWPLITQARTPYASEQLGLVGGALAYLLWFRGIARLESAVVSSLLFLSPVTAALLGWVCLGQALSPLQLAGMAVVIGSIWLSQRANRR